MTDAILTAAAVAKATDQALGDIEDGYSKIMVGLFRLRKAGLTGLEREELEHLISMFREDLQNIPR